MQTFAELQEEISVVLIVLTFAGSLSPRTHVSYYHTSISPPFKQRRRKGQHRLMHAFCTYRSTALRYGGKLTTSRPCSACSRSRCSKGSEIDCAFVVFRCPLPTGFALSGAQCCTTESTLEPTLPLALVLILFDWKRNQQYMCDGTCAAMVSAKIFPKGLTSNSAKVCENFLLYCMIASDRRYC